MIVGMVMMMAMAVGLGMIMRVRVGMVMRMIMWVRVSMVMRMIMWMGMIMVVMMLLCRLPGASYFYRIVSISASACVTHNYSFCSTNKDFICNSVPRISLIPLFLHSGQWLNIPSGV